MALVLKTFCVCFLSDAVVQTQAMGPSDGPWDEDALLDGPSDGPSDGPWDDEVCDRSYCMDRGNATILEGSCVCSCDAGWIGATCDHGAVPIGPIEDCTVIAGTLTLTVPNAAAFAEDATVVTALKDGLAQTLVGVESSWINITNVSLARRRLAGRALSSGSVHVDFEIIVPAGNTAPLESMVTGADYGEAINTALQAKGSSFTVTGANVMDVTVRAPTPSGNEIDVAGNWSWFNSSKPANDSNAVASGAAEISVVPAIYAALVAAATSSQLSC